MALTQFEHCIYIFSFNYCSLLHLSFTFHHALGHINIINCTKYHIFAQLGPLYKIEVFFPPIPEYERLIILYHTT